MFKIIIIEDDKEIREELKILLQNSGYEVEAISEFENLENKIIELTKTELKTLHYLFKNKDKIIPRADIIDVLWDNGVYADDNSLSVIITRLREKLKEIGIENLIETKRGQGYKI